MGSRIHSCRVTAVSVAALGLVACANDQPSYTQFGVPVDMEQSGGVMAHANAGSLDSVMLSVDTMAPISTIDNSVIGEPPLEVDRYVTTVELLELDGADAPVRARFTDVALLESHSCASAAGLPVSEFCPVGLAGQTTAIRGVLGANLLARHAVRFDFGQALIQFFPDIAGSLGQRTALCDAAFDEPFQGGGTLVVGGTEISFPATRIAIDVCFYNDACQDQGQIPCGGHCPVPWPRDTSHAVDALFVLSTALPISVVNRSTYERYVHMYEERGQEDPPPAFDSLPERTLFLASRPVTVRIAHMNRMALVAEASDERGPCGERFLNDYLTRRDSCDGLEPEQCQCPQDQDFCRAAGMVEVALPRDETGHQGFEVAVVPDDDPTLQALRNELRPELPEVSGILGVNVLADVIVDVDYPNDRMFLRCAPGVDNRSCVVRPWVLTRKFLQQSKACLPDDMRFDGPCTAAP